MLGGLFGLYMANLAEDNIEELFRSYTSGSKYTVNGGMLGKALSKVSGGKIDPSKLTYTFAAAQSKQTMKSLVAKGLAKSITNYIFNPYVIAGKMAVGAIYDSQKEYAEEQFKKQIFDLPDDSNKYLIDERFNAVNSNAMSSMDRTNYTVKELLNSGNLAGSLIDRAFGNM